MRGVKKYVFLIKEMTQCIRIVSILNVTSLPDEFYRDEYLTEAYTSEEKL